MIILILISLTRSLITASNKLWWIHKQKYGKKKKKRKMHFKADINKLNRNLWMNEMWVWILFYHPFTMCILLTNVLWYRIHSLQFWIAHSKCVIAENYPRIFFTAIHLSFIISLIFNLMQNFFFFPSSHFSQFGINDCESVRLEGLLGCSFYFNLIMLMVFISLKITSIFMHQKYVYIHLH